MDGGGSLLGIPFGAVVAHTRSSHDVRMLSVCAVVTAVMEEPEPGRHCLGQVSSPIRLNSRKSVVAEAGDGPMAPSGTKV